MNIPRGTTPTFILSFPAASGINLAEAENVYVTLRSWDKTLTKTGEDLTVETTTVSVYLTQAETLLLRPGKCQIQVNWTKNDGSRAASEIVCVQITENLLPEVVS